MWSPQDREGGNALGHSAFRLLARTYADSTSPSRMVRMDEAVAAILSCLEKLSDAHRDVLGLRFLHELPVAVVASRLDKSEGSTVATIRRTLAALRTAMDERGEFTRSM